MRLFTMCMACLKELGHPSFEPLFVPYFDERILEFTCSRGHKNVQVIQSQKFEVLLESGANALLADFTLEASASFSTALERLYEFALKVLIIDSGISNDSYAEMFKEMARQSERQLGGFLALHLVKFGTSYTLNQSITEFRNSVIHKGLIPKPKDAKEFCSKVYDEILKITKKLRLKFPEALQKTIILDIADRSQNIDPVITRSTSTGCMFFSLSNENNKNTFDEAFKAFQEYQKIIEGAVPYLETCTKRLKEEKNK